MSTWTFVLNLLDLNIHITIKKNYNEIMPTSIPHQKFFFYHLPTWGRAGIKLGDAWYFSNVSIIFDCSMLYYLLFWAKLGFIIHFYIIFGTKLLTRGPAQICCFMPILWTWWTKCLWSFWISSSWCSLMIFFLFIIFLPQWHVSNGSIIFDCSMLLYLLF